MNWVGMIIASCVFILGLVVNVIFNKQEKKSINELEELNKKLDKLCVSLKEEDEEDKEVIH